MTMASDLTGYWEKDELLLKSVREAAGRSSFLWPLRARAFSIGCCNKPGAYASGLNPIFFRRVVHLNVSMSANWT